MDVHEPFRQAVRMCLPRANIVVGKFHVIRRVNEALDKVRTRLQGEESRNRKGPLFHNRYLSLRKVESLNYKEQLKLGLFAQLLS